MFLRGPRVEVESGHQSGKKGTVLENIWSGSGAFIRWDDGSESVRHYCDLRPIPQPEPERLKQAVEAYCKSRGIKNAC